MGSGPPAHRGLRRPSPSPVALLPSLCPQGNVRAQSRGCPRERAGLGGIWNPALELDSLGADAWFTTE